MKKLKSVLVIFFSFILLSEVDCQLIFEDGFENGNYEKWKEHIEGNGSTVEICSQRARSGEYSVRFKTRGSRRAELANAPNTDFLWGKEYWVGFSFYSAIPCGESRIIYQHHSTPGKRNWNCKANPNSFTIKNFDTNQIEINTSTDPSRLEIVPAERGATTYTKSSFFRAPLGKWNDVVLNFRYSADNKGFIKVWLNDTLVYEHHGINVYLKDGCGQLRDPRQYMKIGLYPAVGGADGEIYYDEIRIGGPLSAYDHVKPRGNIKDPLWKGDGKADEVIEKSGVQYNVDWALKEDFNDFQDKKWTTESKACRVRVNGGLLHVDDSTHSEGVTIWQNKDILLNNFLIKARARSISEISNLNLMVNTREADGGELLAGLRNGNYEDYHFGVGEKGSDTPATQGYIATLTEQHSRLRKNPGFNLLSEDLGFKAKSGDWYEFLFISRNGVLYYYINDKLVHRYNDPSPLKCGKFGIRSWHSKTEWDFIYIGEILN